MLLYTSLKNQAMITRFLETNFMRQDKADAVTDVRLRGMGSIYSDRRVRNHIGIEHRGMICLGTSAANRCVLTKLFYASEMWLL